MMMNGKDDYIIEVNHVSMCFNAAKEKVDNFKEYIIRLATRKLYFDEFWVLNEISFKVKYGEVLGIVGYNGAGKSTLLKIIAGVMKPSKGSVIRKGSMAPLIELGAGFDMDLSARENIYLNGAILGHSRKYISDKFEQIIDFSELHSFIDMPLKNYSSGMTARLGFAIATITEPDILIIDEILAVGDFKFQQKCHDKISSMLDNNTTVIIVSHSIDQIESLCTHAIWLENGDIKLMGDAKNICKQYRLS